MVFIKLTGRYIINIFSILDLFCNRFIIFIYAIGFCMRQSLPLYKHSLDSSFCSHVWSQSISGKFNLYIFVFIFNRNIYSTVTSIFSIIPMSITKSFDHIFPRYNSILKREFPLRASSILLPKNIIGGIQKYFSLFYLLLTFLIDQLTINLINAGGFFFGRFR